jgi:hypothetical protein
MARGVAGSKLPGKYICGMSVSRVPKAAWYTREPPIHEPLGFRLESASILELTPANERVQDHQWINAQASRSY